MIKKGISITIRIEQEVYDKIVKEAIDKSVMENKIVKVSDIIRETMVCLWPVLRVIYIKKEDVMIVESWVWIILLESQMLFTMINMIIN
jgi:hypothetical protein